MKICLITYTTEYRTGGVKLARVAETLAAERSTTGTHVRLRRVESKAAFVAAIAEARPRSRCTSACGDCSRRRRADRARARARPIGADPRSPN